MDLVPRCHRYIPVPRHYSDCSIRFFSFCFGHELMPIGSFNIKFGRKFAGHLQNSLKFRCVDSGTLIFVLLVVTAISIL